jgi:hypothetical protein
MIASATDDKTIHDRLIKLLLDADRATAEHPAASFPRCCMCRRTATGNGPNGKPYCRACMPKPTV